MCVCVCVCVCEKECIDMLGYKNSFTRNKILFYKPMSIRVKEDRSVVLFISFYFSSFLFIISSLFF